MDLDYKVLIIYIATFNISFNINDKLHPWKRAQIVHLKANEITIKVFSKYTNFAYMFSSNLAIELFKYIGINNYIIKLVDNWQFPYKPIYNLESVKLEILKAYIKNNLGINLIRLFNFFIGAFIFFDQKPIDY